jgi:nucleotide-binding universal stress UspA family protein
MLMKILLAVDGSAYTKKMLAYLVTHADMFSSANTYQLLHVQPALPARAKAAVGNTIVKQYHADEAEKVMGPASKFLVRHGLDPKSEWHVGHAGEVIAKTAEAGDYDLIVMGSHGHTALGNLVMGSVATQVLAHCTVPVLLVR